MYPNPFSTPIVLKKSKTINICAKILMALSAEKIRIKSHEAVPLRDMWTTPCLGRAVVYRQAYTRLFENLLSHVRVSKNS
jgi:hypothetical protein